MRTLATARTLAANRTLATARTLASARGLVSTGAMLTNLLAYYSLEEASDTRVDQHGGYHLTDNNTVTRAAGVVEQAASFAVGSSEYLSRADEAALRMGDVDWCMAGWVYLADKSAVYTIASKFNGTGNQREWQLQYLNTSDRFRFIVSGDGTATTPLLASTAGSPSATTWYFVYAEHNAAANTIGVSVNAGVLDTAAHTTGTFGGTAMFALGATGVPNFTMNGRMDEWAFWKGRVLTAAERTWAYNAGAGRSYMALRAF